MTNRGRSDLNHGTRPPTVGEITENGKSNSRKGSQSRLMSSASVVREVGHIQLGLSFKISAR